MIRPVYYVISEDEKTARTSENLISCTSRVQTAMGVGWRYAKTRVPFWHQQGRQIQDEKSRTKADVSCYEAVPHTQTMRELVFDMTS